MRSPVQQRPNDVHAAEQDDHRDRERRGSHTRCRQRQYLQQKKRGARRRPSGHGEMRERQADPLAEQRRGQVVGDRRPQDRFQSVQHAVADRPWRNHEVVQHGVADEPVGVREHEMSGAAERRPTATRQHRKPELQRRERKACRAGGSGGGEGTEAEGQAGEQRQRRPQFEPSGEENRQRQRQIGDRDPVKDFQGIQGCGRGRQWAWHPRKTTRLCLAVPCTGLAA